MHAAYDAKNTARESTTAPTHEQGEEDLPQSGSDALEN